MSPELRPFATVARKAILPLLFLSSFLFVGYAVSDNGKKDEEIRQAVRDLHSCIGTIKVTGQPWDECSQITHSPYPETPEQFEARLRQEQTPREIRNWLTAGVGFLMFTIPVAWVIGRESEKYGVRKDIV